MLQLNQLAQQLHSLRLKTQQLLLAPIKALPQQPLFQPQGLQPPLLTRLNLQTLYITLVHLLFIILVKQQPFPRVSLRQLHLVRLKIQQPPTQLHLLQPGQLIL